MNQPASTSPDLLRLRFETFIEALCRCVAAEGVKHRIAGPLVVLIWTRLRRLAERFAQLVASSPSQPLHRHRSGKSGTRHELPRGFAWLLRLMPGTAAIAGQFRHLLADPEMAAFIAATPAAGRIFRPVCHTLGIRLPDFLSLPPRTRKPRRPRDTAPDNSDPTEPIPRDFSPPSSLDPRPDIPGWPRFPGATRFFSRRKLRA